MPFLSGETFDAELMRPAHRHDIMLGILIFVCLAPVGAAASAHTASMFAQMQSAYLNQHQRNRAFCCSVLYYVCLTLAVILIGGEIVGLMMLAGRTMID